MSAPAPAHATRRGWLAAGLAGLAGFSGMAGCRPGGRPGDGLGLRLDALPGGWVGAAMARGHAAWAGEPARHEPAVPGNTQRIQVAVLGAGVAGLAAARALRRAGVDDLRVFELEASAGGNARAHAMAGLPCPLGAHYLPVPPPSARAVRGLLHELGLLRMESGRTVAHERHLCHALQERLWTGQHWVEGLLPPAEAGSATARAYADFGRQLAAASRHARFAVPADAVPWSAALQDLDRETFAHWLGRHGLSDPVLCGHLDYCCRDDYGAGLHAVSAWAGLHYFASRHGFGGEGRAEPQTQTSDPIEPHDHPSGVFTWPEGNAWLTQRLAAPLGERVHTGCLVRRVQPGRHGVAIDTLAADGSATRWWAQEVVLALPLHLARRVLAQPPDALRAAAARIDSAPWLVANLLLREPLIDRVGAPPAWDNVFAVRAALHSAPQGPMATAGTTAGTTATAATTTAPSSLTDPEAPERLALGYVDASHQGQRARAGPVVLSAYWAFGQAARERTRAWRLRLRDEPWQTWAARVVAHLARVHPDLPGRLQQIDLVRHGHAMAVPAPGVRGDVALRALRAALQPGAAALAGSVGVERVHIAHADLAGYSVFEEAFTLGDAAGRRVAARLGRGARAAAD